MLCPRLCAGASGCSVLRVTIVRLASIGLATIPAKTLCTTVHLHSSGSGGCLSSHSKQLDGEGFPHWLESASERGCGEQRMPGEAGSSSMLVDAWGAAAFN